MNTMTNAPDLQQVLQVLDLASAPEEAFRDELIAVAQRVATAQGLTLDPHRIAVAAQAVHLRATLPVVRAALPETLTWKERPTDETERQAEVHRMSTGWRGWLRRRFVNDQGRNTHFQMIWTVGFNALIFLNLVCMILRLFHHEPTQWFHAAYSMSLVPLALTGLSGLLMGHRYQQLCPMAVDEALQQKLDADPLARDYVRQCRTSAVPHVLMGDINTLEAHWEKLANTQKESRHG